MIPWWAASLVANCGITAIEWLNRTQGYDDFLSALTRTGPLILVAQWGLFYAWRDAPSFLLAWSFFSACNCAMRIASSYLLVGEPPNLMMWMGLSLMMAGMVAFKAGS